MLRTSLDPNGDIYLSYNSSNKDERIVELYLEYNEEPLASYSLADCKELLEGLKKFVTLISKIESEKEDL